MGEVCEILQWKGEVQPGVPELTEDEKVHLGEELSDVLIYLVRLAGSSLYFCSHFKIAATLIFLKQRFER